MSDPGHSALLVREEENRRLTAFLAGRVGMCLAILGAIGVASLVAGVTPTMARVIAPVLVVIALTAPYGWWGRRHVPDLQRFYVVVLCSDILLTTVGAYYLGGENAVYGVPIYGIYVIMAAGLLSRRWVLAVATVATSAYGSMALSTRLEWIPEQPSAFAFRFTDAWPWMTSIVNAFAVAAIGAIAGLLAAVTDSARSRSRELEQELWRTNRDLEARVERAVTELRAANAALTTKNAELGRTLANLELFARAVSHDLRSPMTAASEALRLATAGKQRGGAELVAVASENLARADRMLVGLRDLMRAVGSTSRAETVPVHDVLRESIADLSAARGGQELPVHVVGNLGEIVARREHLGTIFRNLISNALDHNRECSNLIVEVGREEVGPEIRLFVRDNGIGIPAQIRARIFEPFRQGPEAGKQGLGLGLALVEAIVSQAGGRIWVDSDGGRGSTFRFTLRMGESRVSL